MTQTLSACGLLCDKCNYFSIDCQGCYIVKGSTFWAREAMPDKICPLYLCSVIDKKYNNCGECPELPCQKFIDLKDPNISDEQHNKSIDERVSRLKRINMVKFKSKSNLQNIPGVGPKIEKDLQAIGINCISDLRGKRPEDLYNKLCKFKKCIVDKCELYVFRCAVYYAENNKHDPRLLKWWNWKDK